MSDEAAKEKMPNGHGSNNGNGSGEFEQDEEELSSARRIDTAAAAAGAGDGEEEVEEEVDEETIYLALAPPRPESASDEQPAEPARKATVVGPAATGTPRRSPSRAGGASTPTLGKSKRGSMLRSPANESPNPGEGGRGLELPVLLMRIVATDQTVPIDITGFSVSAAPGGAELEFVYPPGAYIEQRKESPENLGAGEDGEEVACKVAEVAVHVTRPSGMGKGAKSSTAGGA